MGQTAGSLPLKRFVNHPREVVNDALEGYLWTHPNVQLLDGYPEVKVLVSSTWQRDSGQVAILSGGGSGHEPADAGMIGDGMLTAVVCGEIFASPSAFAVSRALEAITGNAGALVVVRSNAGTRLNFKSAVKEVQSRSQLKVKVICVSDDVATSKRSGSRTDFGQARGIAGSLLVCKIAGAAARAGLSLEEVFHEAEAAANTVRTQGVSFHSCSIPGMLPARPIPADEMEVGLGIHGEPGLRVKATASTTAKEIVETIMSQLAKHVPRNVPLCVMLNNLGTVPVLEMQLIAGQVMNSELGPRIKLLIGPAHLMTALDTNGISISVLPLEDRSSRVGTARALDAKRDGGAEGSPNTRNRSKSVHFREQLEDTDPDAHEEMTPVVSSRDTDEVYHVTEEQLLPLDRNVKRVITDQEERIEKDLNGKNCEEWTAMRMISFTETELGDPEGADEEDIASDPEDFHEPSLSLRAQRILAYTSATGWKDAVIPRNPQIVKRYNPQALVPKKPRNRHDDHPLVRAMMTRACQAVLDSEQELNAMDAANADGDLGRNMARAAQLVLQALNDGLLPMSRPAPFFFRLGDFLRGIDGTLSALLSVFFSRAARHLTQKGVERLQKKLDLKCQKKSRKRAFHLPWRAADVHAALCAGEQEVEAVAESCEGQRTFLDALLPALRVVGKSIQKEVSADEGENPSVVADDEDGLELSHLLMAWGRQSSTGSEAEEDEDFGEEISLPWDAIATAAQEGARATASMKSTPCYGGFLGECDLCDAGAMVVAIVLTAMAGPSQGLLQVTSDENVKEVVEIGETIGRGSFGTVYSATLRSHERKAAVKISKRSKESGPRSFGDLDCLDRRIVCNWLFMNKPNVTHVYQVLVSSTFLYVIMEHLDGPDLSDWMLSEEGQGRSELSAMRILHEILLAAREVHRHGFVHRDLKFDNFRFAHGPKSELKLVDVVGTMCFRPDRLISKSWCGTGPFLSPEALLGDVSASVDMWAIGVMAFTMLSGDMPFQASSLSELREAHAKPLATESIFSHVTPQVKSLVLGLLDADQEKRLTVDQALELLEDDRCLTDGSSGKLPLKVQRVKSQSWSFCPDLKPPEVKTLYLIRHGEAVHNIKERQAMQSAKTQAMMEGLTPSSKDFQQRVEAARRNVLLDESLLDAALSPSGKMQALDALAEIKRLTMQGYPQPTAIYVSPLQRTLQTAAILFPEHPGIHVREELRERRTGLPCDQRQRADLVAMRQTFNFMSFDELKSHDRHRRVSSEAETEDKVELRGRTALLESLMRDQADSSLAVVTHKGYLRELEHGPLQNLDAKEFGNCEVRVYQVTLPAEGGIMAKKLYGRPS